MKRLACFQELGEIVQPAEDAVIEVSNGLSICGEMVGVGGVKSTRKFIQRTLHECGFFHVEILSMELKFTAKGANFMSVALSSSQAAQAVIAKHPPTLKGKKIVVRPAIFSQNEISVDQPEI